MGITYVEAEVSNEAGTAQKVRFLVDSGATYSVLPQEVWRALGLLPTRTVDFALADGSIIQRDVRTLRPARLKLSAVGPPAVSA